MKAFILAAGRGERMRPLSDTTPKPLLKAGTHSLIEHKILKLAKAGVHEIVINLCHLGEQIKAKLGNGEHLNVSIQYSDESPNMLGPGGGIVNALPLLGNNHFIVCAGDVWSDFDVATLKTKTEYLAHLVMVDNPDFNPQGDFGITNGLLSSAPPHYTYAGYSVWHPNAFKNFKRGEVLGFMPLIKPLLDIGQISAEHFTGSWHNVGNPEQLETLKRQLI